MLLKNKYFLSSISIDYTLTWTAIVDYNVSKNLFFEL